MSLHRFLVRWILSPRRLLHRPSPVRQRPGLEVLEGRLAPATLTVNSTADTANPGDPFLSLREAVAIVNRPTLPTDLSDQILGQISGTLHEDGADAIRFDPDAVQGPITLGGHQLELRLPGNTARVTIDGGDAGVTLDGSNASRVLLVAPGVDATLDHLTVTHGRSVRFPDSPPDDFGGGGISNNGTLTVRDCTLAGNTADASPPGGQGFGGGIFSNGTLTVSDCTFAGNSASGSGGAIANYRGTLTVTNSTLSANSAGLVGGGIDNDHGTLTVTNSTISANSAGSVGGGIDNDHGTLTVTSSTLSTNSGFFGGGIFNTEGDTLALENTIVAGNRSNPDSGPDIAGLVQSSSSYNLVGIDDGSLAGISDCSQGNQIGSPDSPIDPRLAPLGDYGGPTQTLPLLPGSPAINAGDPVQLGGPDQRGVVRSGGVNIGAFQASAASFVLSAPDSVTPGEAFDLSVAVIDRFGQRAVGYTGTIQFSTSDADPRVVLPPDHTFRLADGGAVTFRAGVTLFSPGEQTLTVTDPPAGSAAALSSCCRPGRARAPLPSPGRTARTGA
jgi:hypothetical protein